jgi:hypothetical protein
VVPLSSLFTGLEKLGIDKTMDTKASTISEKEALKKFLMNLYFKEKSNGDLEGFVLSLRYKNHPLSFLRFLPKRYTRSYELVLLDKSTKKTLKRELSFREKPAIKYFITLINDSNKN